MLVTIEESKKKCCPHIGVILPDGTKLKGPTTLQSQCLNIACMAWRWESDIIAINPDLKKGYCGLAGKP